MTISESEFRACSIGDLYDLANYRFVKEELDENGNTVYVKAY